MTRHPTIATPPVAWSARLSSATLGSALVLFTVRWLLPTEDAASGEQLGWAVAWMLVALAWSLCGPRSPLRPSDLAVLLIVGGHLLGGVVVLTGGGQRRVAMNLMTEWLGLGATWFVLRGPWPAAWRQGLVVTTSLVWLSLAGYASWQHFVELPQMAAEYGPQIQTYRETHAPDVARTLEQAGVPLEEPELTLFEKRLLDSREPFGFFALANTLGGLLVVALLMTLAELWTQPGRGSRVLSVGAALLIGLALLLTKSRTAVVGGLVGGGLLVLGSLLRSRHGGLSRKVLAVAGAGGLLAVVIVAGLIGSGSWDPEVFTQAPRSLLFRWHYWVGTSRLIGRSPLLGIGLGQFRADYLAVKLPEASEEIADPHQAVLDAWVNGGLLAAVGVVWLVICAWRNWRAGLVDVTPAVMTTGTRSVVPLVVGALVPWGLLSGLVVAGGTWDDRLLVLGLVTLTGCGVAYKVDWPTGQLARTTAAIGLLALLVHLQGAGGMAYPAVVQTLWLLLALSTGRGATESTSASELQPSWMAAVSWFLAVVMGLAAWVPVSRSTARIAAGDAQLRRYGRTDDARELYDAAAAIDPWGTTAWGRLVELHLRQWDGSVPADGSLPVALTNSLVALEEVIQRDPRNGQWRWRKAELESRWAERTGRPQDWMVAAEDWADVVSRGPTNADGLARWSDALAKAHEIEPAAQTARLALAQDEINQRWGHVERRLTEETLARLRSRASPQSIPSP